MKAFIVIVVFVLCARNSFTEELSKEENERRVFEETYTAIRDYLENREVLISPDMMSKAELGDHFETINVDRHNSGNAFGNPESHCFTSVRGSDESEKEGGTYGDPNGGGRRLMVTRHSCDFTQAILKCAHAGYEQKVAENPTTEQASQVKNHIEALSSTDDKQREAASKALLTFGMTAVNQLIDSIANAKNVEFQIRGRRLLQKIRLRAAVDKFRMEYQEKKPKKPEEK